MGIVRRGFRIGDCGARIANLGLRIGNLVDEYFNPKSAIRNPKSAIVTIVCLLSLGFAQSQGEAQKPGAGIEEIKRAFYQEDYSRAVSLAEQYLKKYPRSTKARILLARAEMAQGKYEPAYKRLKEAVAAEPGNMDALYYLGVVAGILSQSEYERLFALAPESARVHQLLAESHQVQENTAEAEREYRAALAANPRSVEVLVAFGDLKRSQSDFDEAAKLYSRALEIEPRNYDGIYGLGVCHSFRQDHPRAMEYFRRALKIQPDSAPARLALGFSLTRTQQWAAAVTELRAAAALEPKMRQAYYLLGQSYQRLGRSQEVQEGFKKAEALSRQEAETAQGMLGSEDVILSAPPPHPENRSGPKPGQDRKKP